MTRSSWSDIGKERDDEDSPEKSLRGVAGHVWTCGAVFECRTAPGLPGTDAGDQGVHLDEGLEPIMETLKETANVNSLYLVALMHHEKRPLTDFYYPRNPKREFWHVLAIFCWFWLVLTIDMTVIWV
jgi:hypothetical protein